MATIRIADNDETMLGHCSAQEWPKAILIKRTKVDQVNENGFKC